MDTELVVLSPSESSQSNVERGVKSLKKVANRMSATQNVLLLSDSAGKLPWFPQEGSLRLRIFLTLDDPSCSKAAKIISSFIMFLIVLSSTTFVMQSLPQYRSHGKDFEASSKVFGVVEVIAITFFTIEYVGRISTVSASPHESKSTLAKVTCFIKSPMNVVDLLAILPFYMELFFSKGGGGLAVLRVLRLARIFRIFKLGKYNAGMQMIGRVIAKSLDAFYILVFFLLIGVVLFSSIIFFCEGGEYDEATGTYLRPDLTGSGMEESPFTSIPASFWWVVVTATTVGYGDLYPTSIAGKLVGVVAMHAGILFLALPITIIGANFSSEYTWNSKENLAIEKEDLTEKEKKIMNMVKETRELLDQIENTIRFE